MDKIKQQVMWNRLLAIVEEQAQTLIRTAFSATVREAGDLSAGVFDPAGQMLAQAVTGTPGHVNAMAASVVKFLSKYPLSDLHEGDVLVTNDPWDGTGHLNDFTVVTPIFLYGRAVGLFAATSHIADVGGLGFGADAGQVYEEGLCVPISYLFHAGQVNDTLLELIKANVRDPVAAIGDLYSLTACNEAGGRRLCSMMEEFGITDLTVLASSIIKNSVNAMRHEIAVVENGTYTNEMRIDGLDHPIDLCTTVTVSDQNIAVDFAGSSAEQPRGINVPLTYTQAYASFGVRAVIGGKVPNNAGSLAPITVTAPKGSILNATRPAAVSARHIIGQMLPDVVLGALAKVIPERCPAEGASCLYLPVLMGGTGNVPGGKGKAFLINPFYTGGTGARAQKDGLSCTAFPSGVKNTPVEINETMAPVIMWQKEYMPDSGGAGTYRGGLGQIMEFSHATGEPLLVSKMFDRIKYPARGRDGGEAGGTGSVYLSDGTRLSGLGREVVPAGQHLFIVTPGGGGIGPKKKRRESAIFYDQKAGLISKKPN